VRQVVDLNPVVAVQVTAADPDLMGHKAYVAVSLAQSDLSAAE